MITKRRYPWVAQQNWQDVLFINTPVPYKKLRNVVPSPFDIDTYNGMGWVSIVLFQATHSRPRFTPSLLSFPRFYQMNIRTYVNFGNERGVYFCSINVGSPIVKLGGNMASLPFSNADMAMQGVGDRFHFQANRLFGNPKSTFKVVCEPYSSVFAPHADSLPHFLSERYCIWMFRGKSIVKAPIFHTHWNLQRAHISIIEREHLPFPVNKDTTAYYADFKHAFIHPFETVGKVSVEG